MAPRATATAFVSDSSSMCSRISADVAAAVVRSTFIALALMLVGACHSAIPPQTGPLPDAHSCYLMSRSILTGETVPAPSAVWLLLSDQSKDRFGAHSFSAVILENGRQTPATWHASAKDSILVQWSEAGSERQLRLHEDQRGVRGLGPTSNGNGPGTQVIIGRRSSCALATTS